MATNQTMHEQTDTIIVGDTAVTMTRMWFPGEFDLLSDEQMLAREVTYKFTCGQGGEVELRRDYGGCLHFRAGHGGMLHFCEPSHMETFFQQIKALIDHSKTVICVDE